MEDFAARTLEQRFLTTRGEDDAKAFEILVQLADAWHTHEYLLELADWYEHGRGCEKDEKKAFELVEYVYNHSCVSPYDRSQEDAASALRYYLINGIGCEKDPERAQRISYDFNDSNDRMWEMLTR